MIVSAASKLVILLISRGNLTLCLDRSVSQTAYVVCCNQYHRLIISTMCTLSLLLCVVAAKQSHVRDVERRLYQIR